MSRAKMLALADIADALARLAREIAAEEDRDPDALIPLVDAARIAVTSVRVLREAIARDEIDAFGKQRYRAVRRRDLETWIESRRVRPVQGEVSPDIEARMRRIARERKKGLR